MNYYDRILELLEQGPSYQKAVDAEKAAIRKYGSAAATSLTAPEKAKRVMGLSGKSQAEMWRRKQARQGRDVYGKPKKS